MIVVMEIGADKKALDQVCKKVQKMGFQTHIIHGTERNVVACVGTGNKSDLEVLTALDGVENVVPISKPYKLASREVKKEKTILEIDGGKVKIGGSQIIVMAGPCSVESKEQIISTAIAVKKAGAKILRGGAFKPRTSPYDFQGLAEEGLKLLKLAKKETGLPIITEVMTTKDIELIEEYADILQVGARNVQNFSLLKELGKSKKPVFLKRGMATTIKEWLMSAEYIIAHGNPRVMFCERGIRTFETATRNTLDLNALPVLNEQTHLPVIVDPSHGTGHWQYVTTMACAGVAAGADGIMIEVHPNPEKAWSDGGQSLKFNKFEELMTRLKAVAQAVGRIV